LNISRVKEADEDVIQSRILQKLVSKVNSARDADNSSTLRIIMLRWIKHILVE